MPLRAFMTHFKTAAAELVTGEGYAQEKVAESLGVDAASIRAWIKRYTTACDGSSAPPIDLTALLAENIRLCEESRRLLMEREIVRKATAIFAKKQP